MKKVLLTGFRPFQTSYAGNLVLNPSFENLKKINMAQYKNLDITIKEMDTKFIQVQKEIKKFVEQDFNIIIHFGVSSYNLITFERLGINLMDSKIPDNDNYAPTDVRIDEHNIQNALFATIDFKAIHAHLLKQKIETKISYSAGTFVCNNALFTVLNEINKQGKETKVGLIHVPLDEYSAVKGRPFIKQEEQVMIIEEILHFLQN